ncbi:REP element-mobilizing transposase RayT [Dethiosulfatibacter aminovorans DSM 17477]|uniref:REP element-mobilizing transposase RayT n=1 Tax=Dethiosulfatibacter aminovorans DSM 17477 TaxID=1121476 RepID=A0A1M6EA46_9FIRM|nr:transposase [Dethiosulfatibacter aminovorans]SHI82387.1 REP element-mobilizing transposase RayT [Dethiosulfatibacter aminovorans DSM 17477]
MPRRKRRESSTGIYHVMARGNNQKWIFKDEQDKGKLYSIIKEVKEEHPFKMYAYCIMNNHYHLMVKEEEHQLNDFIKVINQRYAAYYNKNRHIIGHVFQDRYKSQPVEDNVYFLGLLRYIHLNPVEAGIVQDPYQYKWCSYKEYFYETPLLVDSNFVKNNICYDRDNFRKNFIALHRGDDENIYLDIEESVDNRKEKIAERIFTNFEGVNEKSVKSLKEMTSMSYREIARYGKISLNKVMKLLNS